MNFFIVLLFHTGAMGTKGNAWHVVG